MSSTGDDSIVVTSTGKSSLSYGPRSTAAARKDEHGAGGAAPCAGRVGNTAAVLNLINTSQLDKRALKKYSAKCVVSGDHAEMYEYHQARTGAKPGKHTGTREPKKREVRMDNVFRAKREVRRLINANVGCHSREKNTDKFLTLTFAENITDIQEANRHFHHFMKKLRYHYGAFQYLGTPQIQWGRYEKYGVKVWHYHVAVFGLPYIPQKELVEKWGRGTVSIEAMESYENLGTYLGEASFLGKILAYPGRVSSVNKPVVQAPIIGQLS